MDLWKCDNDDALNGIDGKCQKEACRWYQMQEEPMPLCKCAVHALLGYDERFVQRISFDEAVVMQVMMS